VKEDRSEEDAMQGAGDEVWLGPWSKDMLTIGTIHS
jgi:hypothetical protein